MDITEENITLTDKNTLIIGGGGIMGISMLGSLQKLVSQNDLVIGNIKTFVGTSVGSIICFLLFIEFTCDEIIDILNSNSNLITSEDFDFDNIFLNYGIYSGENINKLLENCLKKKLPNEDNYTFDTLHKYFPKKELIITGTNVSLMKCECFSYTNTKNMDIIKALKISYSIPLIFYKQIHNDYIYCDGGVCNIVCLEFIREPDKTLIIYIDERVDTIDSIWKYISKLITTSLFGWHNNTLTSTYKDVHKVVLENENDIDIFDVNKTTIDLLINYGYTNTNLKKITKLKVKNE